ncbi:MAG TPA: hypothetical protein PL105_13155, partial [Caldilineaceae bacterium]|nr:hypothetical protein [Caldilineaceae bacterium]
MYLQVSLTQHLHLQEIGETQNGLTPFIDWETVRKAYDAGPLIGISGRFQAEMIELAAKDLAHGPSHY